jgi:Protein of unknown function (DUF1203)
MLPIRVAAIPTEVAESVRTTMRDPKYGHVAHVEVGAEPAPCRHCLRLIAAGQPRILFTYDRYDRFAGMESLPLPGPVFIHADPCERYPENTVFPEELRASPRTLEAHARGRRLLAQEYVTDGKMEKVIDKFFARADVDYVLVNSATAGCHTFRIERRNLSGARSS